MCRWWRTELDSVHDGLNDLHHGHTHLQSEGDGRLFFFISCFIYTMELSVVRVVGFLEIDSVVVRGGDSSGHLVHRAYLSSSEAPNSLGQASPAH